MDLIYSDNNLNDVGVLKSYGIDLAYGSDENNFEIKTAIPNNVLEIGMFFYLQGSGYGGVIDAKKVSTISKNITLSGRTFEGILQGAVIMPDQGAAYYVANGDANAIIGTLLTRCNMANLFSASTKTSAEISNYAFRYTNLYSGLIEMLATVGMTLKISAIEGSNNKTKFELCAVPITDYSTDEEWTSDEIKVESGIYGNQTNHLICLGSGTLAERHVIHIFCDQDGNVQQYRTTENPLSDSDYILNQSKKVMNGIAEVTEVYDYPSIASVDNYVMLTEQPSDWSKQELFYTKDGDSFEQIDYAIENQYKDIETQPSNWASAFKNYYEIVDGAYSSISAEESHTLLTAQPSDWATNYGNYYTRYSDGVTVTWPSVKPATAERLELQTMEPSDWATNYGNYRTADGQAVPTTERTGVWHEATYSWTDSSGIYHVNYENNITNRDRYIVLNDYDLLNSRRNTTINYVFNSNGLQAIRTSHSSIADYIAIYLSRMTEAYLTLNDMIANMNTANSLISGAYMAYKRYKADPSNDNYRAYRIAISLYETQLNDWLRLCEAFGLYYVIDQERDEIQVAISSRGAVIIGAYVTEYGAPYWRANTYYTAFSYDIAPTWQTSTYYKLEMVAPAFVTSKYFKMVSIKVPNSFVSGQYYRKLTDNYRNLVDAGIKKLAELRKTTSITAKLDAKRSYEIGDIIAVREVITNTSTQMRVAKKILSGTNGKLNVSYTLE